MEKIEARELPDGWELIGEDRKSFFENELSSEPCPEHLLYKKDAEILARKSDRDDFLFYVKELTQPYCVVHLTWRKESQPLWPNVNQFKDKADFLQNWQHVLYE